MTRSAALVAPPPPVDLYDPALFTNRELSWLEFNQRVLDQATAEEHPLLERVKFLSIVCANLDEFFMVRVAGLLAKQRAGIERPSLGGLTVSQQLAAIRQRATRMMKDVADCWKDQLRPELATHGVRVLEPEDYSEKTRSYLKSYFRSDIYPLLTPLAFDPGHPFPLISNRSMNFAVVLKHGRRSRFARVKVPSSLPRFVRIPHETAPERFEYVFAFVEDVIRMSLPLLFPGLDVSSAHLFRIIRDTNMGVPASSADDLLASIDKTLKELRHAPPAMLQVDAEMPRRVLKTLVENFEVDEDIVHRTSHRMDFSAWAALHRLPHTHLKDRSFNARTLWDTSHHEACVFDDIAEQDYLVHHPYDSFAAVETFLRQAATDPHVVAIKMTLYRIGANSPLVDLLIDAAYAGKQVSVLVELKARFDEATNIKWATRLEDAGVHVVYGVENLKTHCKLCLVVRKETDGVKRYAHVGTGNYNRLTSQVYTDLGLFTADPGVLDDVSEVFNALTGYSEYRDYQQLLVAPTTLRRRLIELFDREIGHHEAGLPARIIIKNNAITDVGIIRALYRASQAGVPIDLIVRSACSLKPGMPGVSETIRVRSIVGRFLEHSRLYYFENGGDPDIYIGSADLMERNLYRRVEVLCRVRDGDIARHLRNVVLEAYLRDTARAYELVDGKYERVVPRKGDKPFDAQQFLLDWYPTRAPEDDERPFE